MKQLFLGTPYGPADFERWVTAALREIETASYDDVQTVADAFTITGTLTETRTIDVSTPTAANCAAVIATFLSDLKKRGAKRT